jgi:hypothetical protein
MSHGLQTVFGKFKYVNNHLNWICIFSPVGSQTNLPQEDAKPLTFCVFADKTKLSSFGTQKGYPVIFRCTNLPVGLRNGTGLGGGRIVGWLPIVGLFILPHSVIDTMQ